MLLGCMKREWVKWVDICPGVFARQFIKYFDEGSRGQVPAAVSCHQMLDEDTWHRMVLSFQPISSGWNCNFTGHFFECEVCIFVSSLTQQKQSFPVIQHESAEMESVSRPALRGMKEKWKAQVQSCNVDKCRLMECRLTMEASSLLHLSTKFRVQIPFLPRQLGYSNDDKTCITAAAGWGSMYNVSVQLNCADAYGHAHPRHPSLFVITNSTMGTGCDVTIGDGHPKVTWGQDEVRHRRWTRLKD